MEDLPLDDPEAYALLCRGESIGVFQLEGGPDALAHARDAAHDFDDISALIALYRPGPMGVGAHTEYVERKHGRRPRDPIHPELAESLADDPRRHLRRHRLPGAGDGGRPEGGRLHPGQADLLRRAMGKKKKEILDKEFAPFAEGMRANGYGKAAIDKLWETLVPFADYAFNKAHSAGYGLVSYWTAYLKARYPAEYMAALLTSVRDDKDKSAIYLNECRRMGLKVLPPDVNDSDADFTPRGTDIRFGLAASAMSAPTSSSRWCGPARPRVSFADFHDFLRKVEPLACNKRVVESLVKAGAFDSLGNTRRGLLTCMPRSSTPAWTPSAPRPPVNSRSSVEPEQAPEPAEGEPGPCSSTDSVGGVGQEVAARLRAGDARPLRQRPSAARGRARDRSGRRLQRREGSPRTTVSDGAVVTVGGIISSSSAPGHQTGQPVGDRDTGRPRRQ